MTPDRDGPHYGASSRFGYTTEALTALFAHGFQRSTDGPTQIARF